MSVRVSVNIDRALLDEYFMDPFGDLAKEINRKASNVQAAIRHEAPSQTGLLRSTVRKQPVMSSRDRHNQVHADVVIGSPTITPYLGFILNGTEPHEIRPRGYYYQQVEEGPRFAGKGHNLKRKRVQRKSLRFLANGQVRFATVVHHPGTSPNDFVTRGLIAGFAQ